MDSLLLTDEEIQGIVGSYYKECRDNGTAVLATECALRASQAQLRKVVKWLNGHNDFNEHGARTGSGLLLTIANWQALLKEIK